jgi:hypothetical protein
VGKWSVEKEAAFQEKEKEEAVTRHASLDSCDEVVPAAQSEFFESDRQLSIDDQLQSEAEHEQENDTSPKPKNAQHLDGAVAGILDSIVAEVKIGVREELASVMAALEALRSELRSDDGASATESASAEQSVKETSRAHSVEENLNSTMEESGERLRQDFGGNHIDTCTPSSSADYVPRDSREPSVDGAAMDLAGNDLRLSLLSPHNSMLSPSTYNGGGHEYAPVGTENTHDDVTSANAEALKHDIVRINHEEKEL